MTLYNENINLQEALVRESKGGAGPTTVKKEIAGIKIPLFVPAPSENTKKKEEGAKQQEEPCKENQALQQLNDSLTTKCKAQEELLLKKDEELQKM